MPSKEIVKILLIKRGMTITKLAEKLSNFSGKEYSRANLSDKISRSAIRFDEMEKIAQILGYKIEFIDTN